MEEFNLSPWQRVLDLDGRYLFKVRFYRDPSEFGHGFTFDVEGSDWICRKLDEEDLAIYAEPMGSFISSLIDRYHERLVDETPDDVTYGYVETGRSISWS